MSTIKSITFTPDQDCTVVVTCIYECQRTTSGTDWSTFGNTGRSRAFVTQDGTTTYGQDRYMSATRESQSVQMQAALVGGLSAEVGLDGAVTGLVTCQWWNNQVQAELKRDER